ncbi:MAG: FTR1 family protein [Dehalococcoidia bacterium]|nr:FTR1 family protein [Myxococcales bacterium]MCB9492238.1 FTR1 family protein [Dehalococcoidia bacterium]MCB9507863.1 FTR1 family protein [Myxococcales bacterium]
MRLSVLVWVLAALTTGCAASSSTGAPPSESTTENVRRLGAILDYVAADYGGAVANGAIADQGEYAEQLAFLDDAHELLGQLPARDDAARWSTRVDDLRGQVQSFAPAEQVATTARALRKDLMAAQGVVVAPTSDPVFERGRSLYAANCASCHGAGGGGDGPVAPSLHPPPRSFLDTGTMDAMSPVRVFNALTDGLPGTAMPSFGQLSSSDRWNLAFFVFTWRQGPEVAAMGAAPFKQAGVAGNASALADVTDTELLERLRGAALADDDARAALAFARREAVYRRSGAPFDTARAALGAANAAYRGGDGGEARQLASSAYLDGVEPHEGALAAVDADMVHRLETEFLELREAIADGDPPDQVEQRVLRIGALLDQADRRMGGSGGTRVAILSAAVIVVREGFEAALLVLLLFAIARRSGAGAGEMRAIHLGWLAALGLGVVLWLASGAALQALGGASRELLEGGVSLIAAVVLLAVSHFVLARRDAQRRITALKARLGAASTSHVRRGLILASLSFVAVFREAFEVVLFLRAVMLDAAASSWAIGAGVAIGVIAVAALTALAGRIGQRLKPGVLLTAMGTLLCVLAVMLAGKGVRALQEAGTLSITPIRAPTVEWLGVFSTRQTLVAQVVVLVVFLSIATWPWLRARRHPSTGSAAVGS